MSFYETFARRFEIKNNKEPKPLPTTPEDLTFLERMPLCWRLKV